MPIPPGKTRRPPTVVGKSARRNPRASKTPALPLPHERDESTRRKGHAVEPVIDQARRDIENGQQDTDLRSVAADIFDRRWNAGGDKK